MRVLAESLFSRHAECCICLQLISRNSSCGEQLMSALLWQTQQAVSVNFLTALKAVSCNCFHDKHESIALELYLGFFAHVTAV